VTSSVHSASDPPPTWGRSVRLTESVTVLVGPSGGIYPGGCPVLVEGTESTAIIDPSLDVHAVGVPPLPDGRQVEHVVLTHVHEDHVAGLTSFPAAAVHVHPEDLLGIASLDGLMHMYGMPEGPVADAWRRIVVEDFHYVARPDAVPLLPDDRLDLGGVSLRLVHLPGHTRGHSAVVIEEPGVDTVAVVGDIDLSSFGPYYGDAWSDLESFERSLVEVCRIPARWYVTFHHKGIIEGRATFTEAVERFTGVIGAREARLLAYLEHPRTMDEIAAHRFIYRPGVDLPFVDSVERRSMTMHLERLERRGVVRRDGTTWVLRAVSP
jgi:glyoxylase-like metal-dependent hydrolase (beta-lactamase superfamily II)